jgi:hypothetical protein
MLVSLGVLPGLSNPARRYIRGLAIGELCPQLPRSIKRHIDLFWLLTRFGGG